jgi:murein DD-endopeptidase MepM/ murein hydrolase activator NlpD
MPSPTALQSHMQHHYLRAQSNALEHKLAAFERRATPPGKDLREEVTELASLFIFQMLQAMRRTVPRSGLLPQGFAHDLYYSLSDQEVARHVARREDLGLTSLLLQQLRGSDSTIHPPEPRRSTLDVYRRQQPPMPITLTLPVSGELTSPYGWRQDPLEHHMRFHHGIDIAAPAGSLVHAAAPGKVIFSGSRQGYGNLVILTHANGYQTYYAHNAENLVAVGDEVTQQQPIARLGETGRATGPHLHFEVRKDGEVLDPSLLLHGTPHFLSSR